MDADLHENDGHFDPVNVVWMMGSTSICLLAFNTFLACLGWSATSSNCALKESRKTPAKPT